MKLINTYYHHGSRAILQQKEWKNSFSIERVDDFLQATVRGSRPYDVRMTLSEGRYADGRCSCPDDTVPCKHIVATVLASGDVDPVGGDRSLDTVLAAAPAEELRTLLCDLAADDVAVRKRIYEELGGQ